MPSQLFPWFFNSRVIIGTGTRLVHTCLTSIRYLYATSGLTRKLPEKSEQLK